MFQCQRLILFNNVYVMSVRQTRETNVGEQVWREESDDDLFTLQIIRRW